MDKFLEIQKLLELNPKEKENLNIQITSNETESVIKNYQKREVQRQMASLVNSLKYTEYQSLNSFKKMNRNKCFLR